MDDRTAYAVFGGGGCRVCGWKLERLTLRHCAALLAVENPVAAGTDAGGELNFATVWQAARICAARDERELKAAMWPASGRRATVAGWFAGVRWGKVWPIEWKRFADWLGLETGAMPRFLPGSPGGMTPKGDWCVGMWTRLLMIGLDREAAWWTPLGLAAQMCVARSEALGREVPLLDEQLTQELKEMGYKDEDLGLAPVKGKGRKAQG